LVWCGIAENLFDALHAPIATFVSQGASAVNTQADAASKIFEQVMDSFRKTAETSLSAQKELFQLWQNNWPGVGQSQAPWLDQLRQFQSQWSETALDLARKHRATLDQQYKAGLEAMEQAFSAAESKDPETFRKRAEELCRKNLDCLKEMSEAQIREFQDATSKWVELLTNSVSSDNSAPKE
jgi:hypothetical protein